MVRVPAVQTFEPKAGPSYTRAIDREATELLRRVAPHGNASPEQLQEVVATAAMRKHLALRAAKAAGAGTGTEAATSPGVLAAGTSTSSDGVSSSSLGVPAARGSRPVPVEEVPGLTPLDEVLESTECRPKWVRDPVPGKKVLEAGPDMYLPVRAVNRVAQAKLMETTPEFAKWAGAGFMQMTVCEPRVLLYFGGKALDEKRAAEEARRREREEEEQRAREQ